ncbi:MAG: ABC transporter permease [Gammaproteobacteria bacterium]|nr:ABC transporter permease [Gammaproteobacteria bacterium]
MKPLPEPIAAFAQPSAHELVLLGCWTARGIGTLNHSLEALRFSDRNPVVVDGAQIDALDTAGVWIVHRVLKRLRVQGAATELRGWRPEFTKLLELVDEKIATSPPRKLRPQSALVRLGRGTVDVLDEVSAMLSFIGETTLASAITLTDYLAGIGKAPVFAAIIAIIGCFQGFRTNGGADSVGRQTTRSVLHSIFPVIVTDGLFSVAFSILDLCDANRNYRRSGGHRDSRSVDAFRRLRRACRRRS